MQARQLLTLSGLASVILFVIAYAGLSQTTPGTDKSAEAIKTFYIDHSGRQSGASYIVMLALPFLIIFASAVRSALVEPGDGKSGLWGNILLGGALMAGAGFAVAASLHLAVANTPEDLSASALQALNALDNQSYLAFTGGLGIMLLGGAGVMIPARSGLRWLGWIALVLGVLIFTPVGFVAFIGSGLWIALTSVALTMRAKRAPRAGLRESVATS